MFLQPILLLSSIFIARAQIYDGVAWINEFHYDNQGADQDEFIEVAYTNNTDITSYTVVLYNGRDGNKYKTIDIPDGTTVGNINLSVLSGFSIQNGLDGISLVDGNNNVVEFLSYEGTFIAMDGPAVGMTSEDIGKSESGTTAVGLSLQRSGNGCKGSDFDWAGPVVATPGVLYGNMTISGCVAAPTPATSPTFSKVEVKVATYNIKKGDSPNWKDIVKEENTDILVFTEAGNWWRNQNASLNMYLKEFNDHFSEEIPYIGSTVQNARYSNSANAIMTRFPIVAEWQLTKKELSDAAAHDLMVWKLDVGSNRFIYVIGIHLKCCGSVRDKIPTNDERRNQTMANLLKWIDLNTEAEDGVMLVGDFNSVSPVDTDPNFPGYDAKFEPSSGSNLNDGPLRMLLSPTTDSSKVHTFKDAFREANPTCGSNPGCCADTRCDSKLSSTCPERGYTYVSSKNNYDSRIDFIIVNQAIDVKAGGATVGDLGGSMVCSASDHLHVDAIVGF